MPETTKPCVLIVDDKEDIREALAAAFKLAVFCVTTARTAGEVIHCVNEKCEQGDSCFDLIVMDIDLPDVRGTTLGTWIRERYPNVIIEYLTAFDAPIFRDTAKRQGAGISQKPLSDIVAFVERMRGLIIASTIPGDRRKRGNKNISGMRRRIGDAPIIVSKPMEAHIKTIADARAANGGA